MCNYRNMFLYNLSAISDISFFGTVSITSSNRNQINHQKGYIFLGLKNPQKKISSDETYLAVAIGNLIIIEGLAFNLSKKPGPRSKKVLDLTRIVSKY